MAELIFPGFLLKIWCWLGILIPVVFGGIRAYYLVDDCVFSEANSRENGEVGANIFAEEKLATIKWL